MPNLNFFRSLVVPLVEPSRPSPLVRRCAKYAWIAVLLCIVLLLAQRLPFDWPRYAGFACVAGMVLFGNLFWWGRIDQLMSNPTATATRRPARPALRVAWALYILTMLLPVLLMMFRRRWWDQWPTPAIVWIMTWDLFIAGMSALTSIGLMVMIVARRLKRSSHHSPKHAADPGSAHPEPLGDTCPSLSLSRRRLLLGATALPFVSAGAAITSYKRQEGRFVVRRIAMRLPRLPDRLRGLTISHVSDMHTGRLFRPDHLPAMVDAVNALQSDIVAVTGDIIDHSNDFLPAACDALAQLEHRYGRYLVVGNHDLIDSSREFVKYVENREPHLLIDRHLPVTVSGERIQIAGLGWSGTSTRHRGDPGHERRAAAALTHADPNLFTLALVHHPHAFDSLAPLGVDLTLAGHTHGGQLMLTPPGSPLRLGAGSVMFRYLWGEYYRDRSALYVNAGVGNWFPVRINAPAEIVQIQLI